MESPSGSGAEMLATDKVSEVSRLVSPNTAPKPSYVNLFGNLCSLLFLVIIIYCCIANGNILFAFHPIFMTIGWLIIMTSAVNSVTPGDLATEWMPIRLRSSRHWLLQIVAGTIILLGFLVIVLNKYINEKFHFQSLHAKFGLASIIFMFVTQFGGIGALYSLKLKHYLAPIYTKLIHASLGLLTLSLGVITIQLGIFSKWWAFGEVLRYISLILVLIVMIFTILRPSLKIYFRLKEKIEN